MDDELAATADLLPGFAGFYVDETGQLNVNMARAASADEVRPHVVSYMTRGGRASASHMAAVQGLASTLRVQEAQYNFRQLLTWYRDHVIPASGAIPGITMTDIDERTNRIVIGLNTPGDIAQAEAYFSGRDIPAQVLEFIHFERLDATSTTALLESPAKAASSESLDANVRPTVGGLQITRQQGSNQWSSSLGFNLTASNSQLHFFLTCSHCTQQEGVVTPTEFGQPNPNSNIGIEIIDPPWFDNDSSANCPVGKACKIHDVAMLRYYLASTPALAQVAWPALGQTDYSETVTVTALATAYQGQTVHMIGRTSGRLSGTVQSACVNYYYEHPVVGAAAKLCQVSTSYGADQGDSGGPVVALNGSSTADGLGVQWGRYPGKELTLSFFSPLYGALGDLYYTNSTYGTFDPTGSPPPPQPAPPPPFSVAIVPPFNPVRPNQSCQYNASVSNGTAASYAWYVNGQSAGSDSQTFFYTATSAFALSVWVTSTLSEVASDSLQVFVDAGAPECAEW